MKFSKISYECVEFDDKWENHSRNVDVVKQCFLLITKIIFEKMPLQPQDYMNYTNSVKLLRLIPNYTYSKNLFILLIFALGYLLF